MKIFPLVIGGEKSFHNVVNLNWIEFGIFTLIAYNKNHFILVYHFIKNKLIQVFFPFLFWLVFQLWQFSSVLIGWHILTTLCEKSFIKARVFTLKYYSPFIIEFGQKFLKIILIYPVYLLSPFQLVYYEYTNVRKKIKNGPFGWFYKAVVFKPNTFDSFFFSFFQNTFIIHSLKYGFVAKIFHFLHVI